VHDASKLSGEPSGRRAVDDIVVNRDGEVENVTQFDAVADRAGMRGESADNDD
jgi:hypothetical protein